MTGVTDGLEYTLVFSDEFTDDGRTFYPGDDAFWEAVNLNYWPTGDIEWYDPDAITTQNGTLVIEMDEIENHNLNFRSGMLQSWNKFCFTTGIIEVSLSLPGDSRTQGCVRTTFSVSMPLCEIIAVFGPVFGCWVIWVGPVMGHQLKVNTKLIFRCIIRNYP